MTLLNAVRYSINGTLALQLWRVNKVLQFHRTTVQVRHVAWPAISLIVAAIAVTASMTVISPLEWVRVEIDADTGESIGRCDSDYFGAFFWPLTLLMVIPMVMAGFMAWKTNDVDEALSESNWIFALFVVQIEVSLSVRHGSLVYARLLLYLFLQSLTQILVTVAR